MPACVSPLRPARAIPILHHIQITLNFFEYSCEYTNLFTAAARLFNSYLSHSAASSPSLLYVQHTITISVQYVMYFRLKQMPHSLQILFNHFATSRFTASRGGSRCGLTFVLIDSCFGLTSNRATDCPFISGTRSLTEAKRLLESNGVVPSPSPSPAQ